MAEKMSQPATPTLIIRPHIDGYSLSIQKCKLLVVSGPLTGREYVLHTENFTLGSSRNNDLVIDDATVSRRHCEINLTTDGYAIRDLGSTNGTYVQGVRIQSAFLGTGSEFQLGETRLVFCPLQERQEFKISPASAFGRLYGESTAMRHVFHLAERYAPTDSTILIEGETGTGKEVLADEMHKHSLRSKKPFIVIDCASLARELVASELFGHTKGAFTGAITDRVGAFEAAEGGTVFLDEIGDLSPELQPQLLRVLEKREVRRVGSNTPRPINVRIISATNRKLQQEVNAGRFREDLYFRLSVVHIHIPPLRTRRDDIPVLAKRFLSEFLGTDAEKHFKSVELASRSLKQHTWPGNVRELRNVIELATHSDQSPLDLASCLYPSRSNNPRGMERVSADRPFKVLKQEIIQDFELAYITDLLRRHDGNVSQGAKQAGIERAYLQRLVRKYGLREQQEES
ncbi:MAG: sigma 54-interacting transcriptional regulator [Kiritimatiellia bacterium]